MTTPTILLIDADSLMWASCFAPKESDDRFETNIEEIEYKFNEKVMKIENDIEEKYGSHFDVQHRMLFFEGHGNFRKGLNGLYKANRKPSDIPPLLNTLKALVQNKEVWVNTYPSFVSHNVETDDSLAATYNKWKGNGYEIIICSSDKDLKTIPCLLYDYHYMKQELVAISEEEARYNFYTQMLMGDTADNVEGIRGLGKVKSGNLLKDCKSTFSYNKAVYKAYLKQYGRNAKVEFIKAYSMLKLMTDGVYTPDLDSLTF